MAGDQPLLLLAVAALHVCKRNALSNKLSFVPGAIFILCTVSVDVRRRNSCRYAPYSRVVGAH
jgi:hypothetical protein